MGLSSKLIDRANCICSHLQWSETADEELTLQDKCLGVDVLTMKRPTPYSEVAIITLTECLCEIRETQPNFSVNMKCITNHNPDYTPVNPNGKGGDKDDTETDKTDGSDKPEETDKSEDTDKPEGTDKPED